MTREEFLKDIPGNLKKLMRENGLSAKELATRTGFSQPTIDSWRAGRNKPRNQHLKKIFDFFELGEPPAPPPPAGNGNVDLGQLVVELRRIANAGETLTRQFTRILETLRKVNEHETAIENIEAEIAMLANGRSIK